MKYTVERGETIEQLARRFSTTILDIKMDNGLLNQTVYTGQVLVIHPYNLPVAAYSIGGRGEDVRSIQRALRRLGYNLYIGGIYDSKTSEIIASIQLKYPEKVAASGSYCIKTKAILEKLITQDYCIINNPGDILVLVNKKNALHHAYAPRDLIVPKVPFPFGGYLPKRLLRRDAAVALEQLFAAAAHDGIVLYAVSGYRPYEVQAEIFANMVYSDPKANLYSARAGESEHQTGLCVDVSSPSVNYELEEAFCYTPEFNWLRVNAAEYGYVIRYPIGKETVTGYMFEPWHLRYTGVDAAREIAQKDLALEEFLER